MTNEITWSDTNKALSDDEITQVEEKLGINFPKDYLEVVMKNDGGFPDPNVFFMNSNEESFNNLINLKVDAEYNIFKTMDMVKDRLVDGIVPFGDDPGGNLICFDYRSSDEPTVVFWDHEIAGGGDLEKAITFVCNSFTDLLDMLHEPLDD